MQLHPALGMCVLGTDVSRFQAEREAERFKLGFKTSVSTPAPAEGSAVADRHLRYSPSPWQPRRSLAASQLAPGLAGRGDAREMQAEKTSAVFLWGGESKFPALVLTPVSLPVRKLLIFLFPCCR